MRKCTCCDVFVDRGHAKVSLGVLADDNARLPAQIDQHVVAAVTQVSQRAMQCRHRHCFRLQLWHAAHGHVGEASDKKT